MRAAVFLAPLTAFGLGFWQLHRLQWKLDLVKLREERLLSPPINLPHLENDANLQHWEFRPVSIRGTFLHDQEQLLQPRTYVSKDKQVINGYHVLTPLQTTTGRSILVNRGFIPKTKKDPLTRMDGQVAGAVEVTGIARIAKDRPNSFIPDNEPHKKMWFWVDLPTLANYTDPPINKYVFVEAGLPSKEAHKEVAETYPIGCQWNASLRNSHLQYAITWFTLGVCLTGLSVLFLRKNIKKRL